MTTKMTMESMDAAKRFIEQTGITNVTTAFWATTTTGLFTTVMEANSIQTVTGNLGIVTQMAQETVNAVAKLL